MKTIILLFALFLILNSVYLKGHEKGQAFLLPFCISLFLLLLYFNEIAFLYEFTKTGQYFIEITGLVFVSAQYMIQHISFKCCDEYIAVLGCGLLDGSRISPMLMKRCDEAYCLYLKYHSKIIVTGGKGNDENISEAEAMKKYLTAQGVNEDDILCEAKAANTKENLLFISEIAKDSFSAVSSDFHLLRIFLLSKKYHLHLTFYKSKSAFYYKAYAYLREYAAILWMYKVRFALLYFMLFFLI